MEWHDRVTVQACGQVQQVADAVMAATLLVWAAMCAVGLDALPPPACMSTQLWQCLLQGSVHRVSETLAAECPAELA